MTKSAPRDTLDDTPLEQLEKVLGFRVSSSGADMRITIGSRPTWINSEDAIALRDAILAWHTAYITKQVEEARIDELNLANDIILSGKVTAGYYEEAKQYIKNRLKQLRKAK